MRKLVAVTQMALDGVMQAPDGPEEDPTGGFEIGGWSFGYFDDELGAQWVEGMSTPFDLVLGRRTCEIFAAHWPYSEGPTADAINSATKHAASRTLESVDWDNSKLIEGDVATTVRSLKEDGPELQIIGSSDLPPDAHRERPRRRVPPVDLPGRRPAPTSGSSATAPCRPASSWRARARRRPK